MLERDIKTVEILNQNHYNPIFHVRVQRRLARMFGKMVYGDSPSQVARCFTAESIDNLHAFLTFKLASVGNNFNKWLEDYLGSSAELDNDDDEIEGDEPIAVDVEDVRKPAKIFKMVKSCTSI